MRFRIVWIAFWVLASSCGTNKTATVKSNDRTGNEPTLVGKWKFIDLKMPLLDDQLKAVKNDQEKKETEDKIANMRFMIIGSTIQFNKNLSYTSKIGIHPEAGTWKFSSPQKLIILTPTEGRKIDTIEVQSLDDSNMKVRKVNDGIEYFINASKQ